MGEIGLQELIYQIKHELLAPNPKERARDPEPLFFIDKIDLEIAIKVTKEGNGGIKLTVLSVLEAGGGVSQATERGHVVKVSLSPLMSREEILRDLLADPDKREVIKTRQKTAMLKWQQDEGGPPE